MIGSKPPTSVAHGGLFSLWFVSETVGPADVSLPMLCMRYAERPGDVGQCLVGVTAGELPRSGGFSPLFSAKSLAGIVQLGPVSNHMCKLIESLNAGAI